MINPTTYDTLYNPHRTDEELVEFLLFCIAVAGHNALSTARGIDAYLQEGNLRYGTTDPVAIIMYDVNDGFLIDRLRRAGIGCYSKNAKAFQHLAQALVDNRRKSPSQRILCGYFDLHMISPYQLEKLHGIGPKTARYFVMYTQDVRRPHRGARSTCTFLDV